MPFYRNSIHNLFILKHLLSVLKIFKNFLVSVYRFGTLDFFSPEFLKNRSKIHPKDLHKNA
ncbi:MAG: hypothetical protein D6805_09695 [Planctomycetota bacterium]|nr:MAG: hypothetical protein D6805_09695 [Planctomycetota bacterium]